MMAALARWIDRGANGLLLGLALLYALIAINWVGFIASDDVTFARGAYGWIEHFPFVGGHGTIRYTITIPMALAFRLFGENEFAMALPGILYLTGFVMLAWRAVADVYGKQAAFGATLALATSPLLVIDASVAGIDIIEMFFLWASVYLFWRCTEDGPTTRRLIGAGAMAGIGFLTRETAIFIALFYAVFFVIGYRFDRRLYLWIAAGFLAIWSLELLYLGVMTGDPFYRFNIALHHDPSIDRTIDLVGNVIVNPLIDPLLVLLINQEFMLLFFFLPPLVAWHYWRGGGRGKSGARGRNFLVIITAFALIWFGCVAAAQKLLPLNPRYFMICAAIACIFVGLTLAQMMQGGRRWLAVTGFAVLIGTNLVGSYVENKDSVFGERQFARLTAAYPNEVIATDPMTRYRAELLLRWGGARERATGEPPRAGQLYFYNSHHADVANFKMTAGEIPLFKPQPRWRLVGSYEPQPSLLAVVLERAGIAPHLPAGIWHKLRNRHPRVFLYRVPTQRPAHSAALSSLMSWFRMRSLSA